MFSSCQDKAPAVGSQQKWVLSQFGGCISEMKVLAGPVPSGGSGPLLPLLVAPSARGDGTVDCPHLRIRPDSLHSCFVMIGTSATLGQVPPYFILAWSAAKTMFLNNSRPAVPGSELRCPLGEGMSFIAQQIRGTVTPVPHVGKPRPRGADLPGCAARHLGSHAWSPVYIATHYNRHQGWPRDVAQWHSILLANTRL